IAFRKIIKPERVMLRLLERVRTRYLPEHLEVYFDDIVDSAERIWDQLDNYKEVIEALEQTNETVIAHKQNDILRVLTVFSAVVLPLTLISGIFGMNVPIPFQRDAHSFWDIIVGMVLIAGSLLGYFRYKRWI
ncbi:MAG: magnesium transporter, partial [Gaiellales bacterium]|nr:magnesium transporter [Gaiellales bacterium]